MTTEQVLLVLVCARDFQKFERFTRMALLEYERFVRNAAGCFEQFVRKASNGISRGFLDTAVSPGCIFRSARLRGRLGWEERLKPGRGLLNAEESAPRGAG